MEKSNVMFMVNYFKDTGRPQTARVFIGALQIVFKEALRVAEHDALGLFFAQAEVAEGAVERGGFGRRVQKVRQLGAVIIGTQRQVLFGAQLEETLDVLHQLFGARHVAVVGEELDEIVQADQTVALDHLADHVVGQVALVRADAARVGVGGDEGLFRDGEQVFKAGIVEVRHVDEDALFFHLRDDFFAEG